MPNFHSPLPRPSGKHLRKLGAAGLLAMTLILAGCGSDEETAVGPSAPTTSLSLAGVGTGTLVSGARFGPDFDNVGILGTYGVTVTLSSSPSGTTYWRSDASDCTLASYAQYSAASKPFFLPDSTTTDQSW